MANEEEITFDFEFDYKYKSVIVSYDPDSMHDFLSKLPEEFRKYLYKLLETNKDKITFIPFKVAEGLYGCIYKTIILEEGEKVDEFTLYAFQKKKDMVDLLERKPLKIEPKLEEKIKEGILNL